MQTNQEATQNRQDYPAAHSMDTEWFAVDADGNIGFFDSSEGGAVPETWSRTRRETKIEYVYDFLEKWRDIEDVPVLQIPIPGNSIEGLISISNLLQFMETVDHNYDLALKRFKRSPQKYHQTWIDVFNFLFVTDSDFLIRSSDWILQFKSDDAFSNFLGQVNELSKQGNIIRFSGDETVVGVYEFLIHFNRLLVRKLMRSGDITSAKPVRMSHHRDGNHLHEIGLFPYTQSSSAPIPYEKMADPIIPLKLDDLPEELQDQISWTWFDDIRFTERQLIQPLEHMKCNTWSAREWWIDTQGQEREGHPFK